jgi:hypothetical protein
VVFTFGSHLLHGFVGFVFPSGVAVCVPFGTPIQRLSGGLGLKAFGSFLLSATFPFQSLHGSDVVSYWFFAPGLHCFSYELESTVNGKWSVVLVTSLLLNEIPHQIA